MSQVIIVSNRLPVSVKKDNGRLSYYPSVGGLATGLSSYVNDRQNIWIGWPGIASDGLSDADKQEIGAELARHNCSPVWLSQRQIEDFYSGYSNSVLWPLFHNLKQSRADAGRQRWWSAYRQVNKLFVEAVLNLSESGGRVWVHDYQLMLVPEQLRAERRDITIGFFLHIPFPDSQTFGKLPEAKKLLNGITGADVVGFHTASYVAHFLENCEALGVGEAEANQLLLNERTIRVADFPMGIDYEKYSNANKSPVVKQAVRKYRRRYRRRKLIVAVDRLDPSKGLVGRLEAYRKFLQRYPRQHGKVIFSMVVAPSRTDVLAYQQLSRQLGDLVSTINKQFGNAKWQPVDYINQTLPFEEVTALFRLADVAFIAPLRDGMNLAAKEFVASAHKNGVLILSETAGASEELQDAIIVNPNRPETLVSALYQALTMRRRELRLRLGRMRKQLAANTVHEWAHDFVETLQKPLPGPRTFTRTLGKHLAAQLVDDFRHSQRRLLLLDYDGSLVPFAENYQHAKPPQSLLDLLKRLSRLADVVLISGRSPEDLEKWFGKLPINLVGEHGAAIKRAGNKSWRLIERPDTAWKRALQPALEKYVGLTPRARLEVKPHSLVWHYRGSPPYYAQKYATIIKRVFKPILKSYGLEILQGNKVLEIKNPQISKAKAAQEWLKRDYGFVLSLGDDMTDEELFAVLSPEVYSLRIGRGRTAARFRVASHKEVLSLLRRLSRAA